MFEADITKVVEEMSVHIRETEEEFILDTIFPYCQETLQRKINKAELKQIILRGSRPKGKCADTIRSDFGTPKNSLPLFPLIPHLFPMK